MRNPIYRASKPNNNNKAFRGDKSSAGIPKQLSNTGPPGLGIKQIPIKEVLGDALKCLEEEGVEAVCVYLEKLAGAQGRTAVAMALRLTTLASQVQQKDPKSALQLALRAIGFNDQDTSAWLLVGSIQDRLGDRKSSAESMRKVVRSPLSRPEQILRAANLLVRFGDQKEALVSAKAAFVKLGRPIQLASTLMYIAKITADWVVVDQLKSQLSEAYDKGHWAGIAESPRTHLLWCDDEATNLHVLKQWSERTLRLPSHVKSPIPDPLDGRRIRLGYLSSDFRDHPTSRLINGLLKHHDKSKFELFMYCSSWDDNSDMRREIESHFEHHHAVAQLSDESAAQLIRSHRIDVLVELNGPTRAHRMGILAHRPAPIQIDYLGWPGSVGGRVVDYIVGDDYTVPSDVEALYPEKVIKLSKTYQINDFASRTLPARPSRQSVGLPEGDYLILGMFNAINKVDSTVWDAWMRIMKAVPKSLMWLLDPGPVARQFIVQETEKHGVSPKRIVIAPRLKQDAHLARMQCCDLMLDPWPYGGHTSTSDALFARVPVIALEGTNFASRVSGGLLRAAGMGVMVQSDVESYVLKTIEFLNNPKMLSHAKIYLTEKVPHSDLFDSKGKTQQFEKSIISILNQHISQLIKNFDQGLSHELSNNILADKRPFPKVAIITPYFKESDEIIGRCIRSVEKQTHPCIHFLISDGHPKNWLDNSNIRHITLGKSHSDYGNTPRGIGAQLAISEDFDAIAFLDADNWYDSNHVETCIKTVQSNFKNWLECDYIIAKRRYCREDLTIMNIQERNGHVDTNCYFFLPGSFFSLPTWNLIPKDFASIGDRVFYKKLSSLKLNSSSNKIVTVNYFTLWASHYKSLGETVPINAKPNVSTKQCLENFMKKDLNVRTILQKNIEINLNQIVNDSK